MAGVAQNNLRRKCIVLTDLFFEQPVLNSPYERPSRHWELDETGQPTQQIVESRRPAEYISPIPQPKKRKGSAQQGRLAFGEEARKLEARRSAIRPGHHQRGSSAG